MNVQQFKKIVSNKLISDDVVLGSIPKLRRNIIDVGCIESKLSAGVVLESIRKHRPHLQIFLEVAYILSGVAKAVAKAKVRSQ